MPSFFATALSIESVVGELASSRTLRLFVSSSFLDFQQERKLLHEKVFPKLRRVCEARGLILNEVDLRWGVKADASGPDVIDTCLSEVNQCLPYFLCFLGARYGWCPPKTELEQAAAVSRYDLDWIPEHAGCSITHLEIMAGVLRQPARNRRALVYLRDSDDCLPDSVRAAVSKNPDTKPEAVTRLRTTLERTEGITCRHYTHPDEVADVILQDLLAIIERDFPTHVFNDQFEEEDFSHAAFARARLSAFVLTPKLRSFVGTVLSRAEEGPLLIRGPSGAGKSSLVAHIVKDLGRKEDAVCHFHFIGQTTHSGHYINVLQRLLHHLKAWAGDAVTQELPQNPTKMLEVLPSWLVAASDALKDKTVYIVLDALNQLQQVDRATSLHWLPQVWPDNFRLIATSTETLSWSHAIVDLPLMDAQQREMLISSYLTNYAKDMEQEQRRKLMHADHVTTPMYLTLLLDELRIIGQFNKLDEQLDTLLAARDIHQLLSITFKRWENSFARLAKPKQWTFRPLPGEPAPPSTATWNLVEAALVLLRASRQGLRESELLQLLGVERGKVGHFLHALEEIVQSQSGLLIFSHSSIERTIDQTYMRRYTPECAHATLAAFFSQLPDHSTRKQEELPHHLLALRATSTLADFLSSYTVFSIMTASDFSRLELSFFWRQMGTDQACDRYKRMLEARMNLLARGPTTSMRKTPASTAPLSQQKQQQHGQGEQQGRTPRRAYLARMMSQDASAREEDTIKRRITAAFEIAAVGQCLHEWAEYADAQRLCLWALSTLLHGMQPLLLASSHTVASTVEALNQRIDGLQKRMFKNSGDSSSLSSSSSRGRQGLMQLLRAFDSDKQAASASSARSRKRQQGPPAPIKDSKGGQGHDGGGDDDDDDDDSDTNNAVKGAGRKQAGTATMAVATTAAASTATSTAATVGAAGGAAVAGAKKEGGEKRGLHNRGSIQAQIAQMFDEFGSDTEEALLMTAAGVVDRLARLLMHKSEAIPATLLFRASLRLRLLLQGPEHKSTSDVLGDLAWLAIVRKKYKHSDGAVALLKQAIHAKTRHLREKLGMELEVTLDHHIPEEWLQLFAAIRKCCAEGGALGVLDFYLPPIINRLAVALASLNQHDLAEEVYACSIEAHEAMLGKRHPALATVCGDIGSLCLRKLQMLKRKQRREKQHATEGQQQKQKQGKQGLEVTGMSMGLHGKGGVGSERDSSLSAALSPQPSDSGPVSRTGSSTIGLSSMDTVEGLQVEALRWYDRGLAIRAATLGTKHPFYASLLFMKTDCLMETRRWREAGPMLEEVLAVRTAALGDNNRQTGAARRKLEQWRKWKAQREKEEEGEEEN